MKTKKKTLKLKTTIKAIAEHWDRPPNECWACHYIFKDTKGISRCHIIPAFEEGLDVPDNYLLLCSGCHKLHPDTAPREFQLKWLESVDYWLDAVLPMAQGLVNLALSVLPEDMHQEFANWLTPQQVKIAHEFCYENSAAARKSNLRVNIVGKLVENFSLAHGTPPVPNPHSHITSVFLETIFYWEKEENRRLTRKALQRKKDNNEYCGGKLPYGKKLADGGVHLEDNNEEQLIIAMAYALRADKGLSLSKIAKQLNEDGLTNRGHDWHKVSVHRMMKGKPGKPGKGRTYSQIAEHLNENGITNRGRTWKYGSVWRMMKGNEGEEC